MENDDYFVKIKDHEHLLRDPVSNSIMNINDNEYDEYIARRDAAQKAKEQSAGMESDLANLKGCLLYASPRPRAKRQSRMQSSA